MRKCATGSSSGSRPTSPACSAGARRRWNGRRAPWSARFEDLEPLLIGQDPRDIEQCLQITDAPWLLAPGRRWECRRSAASRSRSGTSWANHSASPVWRLLGGKVRDSSAHLYASRPRRHEGRLRDRTRRDTIVERGRIVTQAGYDAVKVVCIPYTHYVAPAKRDVDQVARHGRRTCATPSARTSTSWSISTAARLRSTRRWTTSDAIEPRPHHVRRGAGAARRRRRACRRSPHARRCRSLRASAWSAAANSSRRSRPRLQHRPARHLPYRRAARGEEDRGDGRDGRHRPCAAQSARADRRRRRAAFRHLDAQRHHPGGDVGRGRLVRRCRRPGRSSASQAAGTCRECRASASRSTRP